MRGPAIVLAGVLTLAVLTPLGVPAPAGAAVLGCDQADVRTEITVPTELDPTCTYTAGFDLTTSGASLNCQGARIDGTGRGGAGILIHTPTDVALDDVAVRSCGVTGFLNSLKVTRDGFRTLPDDAEFTHPTTNILIEGNRFADSIGVGVYVDGYVSGVSIRENRISGTGSSGIYLETGSKGTEVIGNEIIDNGYRENGPGGKEFDLDGTTVWFWGPGREGISVDGSYENTIHHNRFSGNSAGGIFLYKNCGEYPDRNPGRYFERRDPADRNTIESNDFEGERIGVWVGSRMGENTLPMECSDPAYVEGPGQRIVLDYAKDNTVADNSFTDVIYGVLVEDDGTTVTDNQFTATSPDHHGVIIGTPYRTEALDRPVERTTLTGNRSEIVGNDSPYRWVHGHTESVSTDNRALGQPSALCEGVPYPRNLFVMTIAVAPPLPDGSKPPTPDLTIDEIDALPSCQPTAQIPATTVPATDASSATPGTATPAVAVPGFATYTG